MTFKRANKVLVYVLVETNIEWDTVVTRLVCCILPPVHVVAQQEQAVNTLEVRRLVRMWRSSWKEVFGIMRYGIMR